MNRVTNKHGSAGFNEYSKPVVSSLWKLSPQTRELIALGHKCSLFQMYSLEGATVLSQLAISMYMDGFEVSPIGFSVSHWGTNIRGRNPKRGNYTP